ncbi:MAG TPA: DNA-formamidopyrimidine glycosylase family protein [Mycobacteriales bacterium]|jgi:endonuclease-8|nr:DNA-formamidopyrimidine glycosylase family protein [Mycobacteriales bacterium]
MPEGDTVWLAAQRMHRALAGRPLTRSDLRVPALATTDLTGRTVREVLARGKHMLTRIEPDLTLRTHFRMDGSWRLVRAGARWNGGPAHQIRAVLANADWQALGFRLHDITLLPTAEEADLVGHLGPDVLGPDWDPAEATRRLEADPRRPIGEALHDQRTLAGVGNLYQNELVFLAGVTPWTETGDIGTVRSIVDNAHRIMSANRQHPEQSTTGDLRRGATHWVYQRAGQPCRRCGTSIRTARLGTGNYDRVAFWCPRCQRGPAPKPA